MTGPGATPQRRPSRDTDPARDGATTGTAPEAPGDVARTAAAATAVPLLRPRDGLPAVVASDTALTAAAESLAHGEGPVAVDAERASGYRYGQRAYLVQLRRAGTGTVLIDPVACPDLTRVHAALRGVEAVLHAASQDLPCLAEIGYRPAQLFDTELAGRLLGFPRVALGTLVETVLGFHLEKGYAAGDWSRRPLPEEWLRYAALDVELLVELRDELAAMLATAGKLEWARQEFAAVVAAPPPVPHPHPWRRTSGIHRVRTRRRLAVVRELWHQRDTIAREVDLAPGRVLPDAAIVAAARAFGSGDPATRADVERIAAFTRRTARRYGRAWLAATRRAQQLPPQALPEPNAGAGGGPPPTARWADRDPAAAARLAAVRQTVTGLAGNHNLPAENLLPPDAVRRLAWEPPAHPDADTVAAALRRSGARPWQVDLTAQALAAALSPG